MVPSTEQLEVSAAAGKMVAELKYPYPALDTTNEWQRYLRILEKQWRLGALLAGAIFIAIAIVTYRITPVYESTARLEIDPPGSEAFSLSDNPGAVDEDYRDTQSEILKSDALAIAVIRKLHLERHTRDVGKHTFDKDTVEQ